MKKRSFMRDMDQEHLGYYGLHKHMVFLWDEDRLPRWVGRVYWWFQPLRCRLGWHNWYDTAAGLCSACTCGKEEPYPVQLVHKYRWNKTAMRLAARYEEERYRADSFQEWYLEARKELTENSS